MRNDPHRTRESLLDAAETLFAERGWKGANLREITSTAGVGLAAASYHFGGKEDLLRAVLERRVGALNARRLERLDALEAEGAEPDLEAVLGAFLDPVLESTRDPRGRAIGRLVGRAFSDPNEPWSRLVPREAFDQVLQRFLAALRRLLPELDDSELLWRLHFVVGAMAHPVLHGKHFCERASRCGGLDMESDLAGRWGDYLKRFVVAGLGAAPSPPAGPLPAPTDSGDAQPDDPDRGAEDPDHDPDHDPDEDPDAGTAPVPPPRDLDPR